jgi:hypothetical protein
MHILPSRFSSRQYAKVKNEMGWNGLEIRATAADRTPNKQAEGTRVNMQ